MRLCGRRGAAISLCHAGHVFLDSSYYYQVAASAAFDADFQPPGRPNALFSHTMLFAR